MEDLNMEDLDGLSVDELLKQAPPPDAAALKNFGMDPVFPRNTLPNQGVAMPATPVWPVEAAPQAMPPTHGNTQPRAAPATALPRAAPPMPALQPMPAPEPAPVPELRLPAPAAEFHAPADYRAQLDLARHEMNRILNRQFEDIETRFASVLSEMHERMELAEKSLRITEQAIQKKDEELIQLRRENSLFRRKLKELADVRAKMDEVFGG